MSNAMNQLKNVPVDKVNVVVGFNSRAMPAKAEDDPEIIGLANDIKENGLLQPLRVVPRDDGNFDLVAGHRRLMAIQYANEHLEAGIKSIPAIVTREMTDEQRDAYILADRFSSQLKPLEAANALKRFMDRGMSQTDVAKRFHLTVAYAGDLKLLGNAPEVLKEAVEQGVFAATEAIRLQKEYGEEGAEVLAKDALEESQATTLADTTTEASGDTTEGTKQEDGEATPVPAMTKKRRGKAANDAVAKAKNIAPKRPKNSKPVTVSEEAESIPDLLLSTMIRIDRLISHLKVEDYDGARKCHVELGYKLRAYLQAGHSLNGDALSGIQATTPDEELEFMGEPVYDDEKDTAEAA